MMYLSTAIGFTTGGSSTIHIYTQQIHRTTQNKTTQITNNLEDCWPYPRFASFTPAFALQLRKKHGKTFQGRKNPVRVGKTSVSVGKTSVRVKKLSQGNLSFQTTFFCLKMWCSEYVKEL